MREVFLVPTLDHLGALCGRVRQLANVFEDIALDFRYPAEISQAARDLKDISYQYDQAIHKFELKLRERIHMGWLEQWREEYGEHYSNANRRD